MVLIVMIESLLKALVFLKLAVCDFEDMHFILFAENNLVTISHVLCLTWLFECLIINISNSKFLKIPENKSSLFSIFSMNEETKHIVLKRENFLDDFELFAIIEPLEFNNFFCIEIDSNQIFANLLLLPKMFISLLDVNTVAVMIYCLRPLSVFDESIQLNRVFDVGFEIVLYDSNIIEIE